jgi:hypothetical protein
MMRKRVAPFAVPTMVHVGRHSVEIPQMSSSQDRAEGTNAKGQEGA